MMTDNTPYQGSSELYEVNHEQPGFEVAVASRVDASSSAKKKTPVKKASMAQVPVSSSESVSSVDNGPVVTVQGKTYGKANKKREWFIVHTYSGHENKVKTNLERRIASMGMQQKIFRIEVPSQTVIKSKGSQGKRSEKEEKLFPGYVLVEMIMDDDSWYVVRYTPGVTRFIGNEKDPIPARPEEIKRILMGADVAQGATPKIEIDVKVNDVIQIISGPFSDFEGVVTDVMPEKERLKATVSIFGRETPVELHFSQIQKYS
ncbi:MAG: transcription termination/antitermination protein NusG [Vampirovibrionales bacterium]